MRRPRAWGDQLDWAPTRDTDIDARGLLGTTEGEDFVPRFVLRARVEQPPRPFLMFQDDDIAYAERAVVDYLFGDAA